MAKFSIQAVKVIDDNIGTYEDEPVTVAQLKEFLQIEGTAYDGTLANFISSARLMIERYCNVSLTAKSLRAQIRNNPVRKAFPLPYPPINEVSSVTWRKCACTTMNLVAETDWWFVDPDADEKEIESSKGGLFFIDYTTAADTRTVWQDAILAQCGYMYNNRDSDKAVKLAPETAGLIEAFRNHYY